MRKLVVAIISTACSLFATAYLIKGFAINPTVSSYLTASLVLLLFNAILLPLVKLLLLPINLLTLGLFRWIASVIVLYVFDTLYQGVTISGYDFTGFTSNLFALPSAHLSFFWTLILSSFSLSLFYSLASSLLRADEA